MFVDARTIAPGTVLETEICIVGGGAAGITLARAFIAAKVDVALVESGGFEYEPDTQALYQGADIGRPYQDLTTCRLRYFGGSTNHWGGWCLPLDPVDFEEREGLPCRGWPIRRVDLDPWYREAQDVCQLGSYDYEPANWGIRPDAIPAPFLGERFGVKILQTSPPTRFGEIYAPALRQAAHVAVYLHANALGFDTDEAESEVRALRVATLSGNRFQVRARIFIAATGGIENARLLLLSGRPDGNGLGNRHDLVGRYFMTHLEFGSGIIAVSDPNTNFDFCRYEPVVSFVGLSDETMRRLQLPNIRITWKYQFGPAIEAINAAKRLAERESRDFLADISKVIRDLDGLADFAARKALFHGGAPVEALNLWCHAEHLPNSQSRIRLGNECDALGLRKTVVDWRVSPEDKRGVAAIHRLLGAEVGRPGFGRLRCDLGDDDISWPEDFQGNEHHMGTTRMHNDPRQGVVDANCRVHGLANLYVAGSSVFPTSGAANPTLTIVALALRLAEHIKARST